MSLWSSATLLQSHTTVELCQTSSFNRTVLLSRSILNNVQARDVAKTPRTAATQQESATPHEVNYALLLIVTPWECIAVSCRFLYNHFELQGPSCLMCLSWLLCISQGSIKEQRSWLHTILCVAPRCSLYDIVGLALTTPLLFGSHALFQLPKALRLALSFYLSFSGVKISYFTILSDSLPQ